METNKRFHALDIIKLLLQWALVSILGFGYWIAMLLVLSLILLNVWFVTFETIVEMSTVLAVVTSIVYAVILVKRNI